MEANLSGVAKRLAADYAAGGSLSVVAKRHGVSRCSVYKAIHQCGIPARDMRTACRRYSLNENAFDVVTEESAYWVGFIMADGHVGQGKQGSPHLSVGLAKKDRAHVVKLRSFLGAGHPIRSSQAPARLWGKYLVPPTASCSLALRSPHIVEVLHHFGVLPRKSFTAKVTGGLENNRHFWRGVIDGDGCIHVVRRQYSDRAGHPVVVYRATLILVGAQDLLRQFVSFVKKRLPKYGGYKCAVRVGRKIYDVAFYSSFAAAVVRLLYSGASVSLDRKAKLAEKVMRCAFLSPNNGWEVRRRVYGDSGRHEEGTPYGCLKRTILPQMV